MNHPNDNAAGTEELKQELKDYWKTWDRTDRNAVELLKGQYIDNLLEKIMRYVKRPERPCTVLALCVGLSWEPLIQTIYAYRPDFLLAIFSKQYRSLKREGLQYVQKSDSEMKRDFLAIVKHLHSKGWTGSELLEDNHTWFPEISDDTPSEVFRVLQDGLNHFQRVEGFPDDGNIVVDITGARKSMTSGVYLYAAYTRQFISYVDQDETRFDDETGRMFDFHTSISGLGNPYELFGLREWETVRELYRRNNFAAAQRTLASIIAIMEGEGRQFFDPDHVGKVQRLHRILQCYQQWDSGDLHKAWESEKDLKTNGGIPQIHVPLAVSRLGPDWPPEQADPDTLVRVYHGLQCGDPGDPQKSIFLDGARLILYAYDELQRIHRLIVDYEDHRSALLRSAGLSEMLIKARWAALWKGVEKEPDLLMEAGGSARLDNDVPFRNALYAGLFPRPPLVPPSLSRMRDALEDPHRRSLRVFIAGHGTEDLKVGRPSLALHLSIGQTTLSTLANLRNSSIHFCLQVSPELAKQTLALARASLEEYQQNWVAFLGQPKPEYNESDVTAMEWPDLCQQCGLDFLPGPLRRSWAPA